MPNEKFLIDSYLDLLKKALTGSIYDQSMWSMVETYAPPLRALKSPRNFCRDMGRHLVVRSLRKRSMRLMDVRPYDSGRREEGRDWPSIGYSMIGHKRLENIQFCVESVLRDKVPGDLIETGAWRGGACIFMRGILKAHGVTDRKVWVADSFEGLPAPRNADDGMDLSNVDMLKVSVDEVKGNFDRFGLLDDQVGFLEGWFCDTLPNAPIQTLAVLRLDGDLYHSTMDSLENLYHKVSPGGYVLVDDYGDWKSCRAAVHDFLDKHSLKPDIMSVDWTGVFWRC